MCSGRSTRSRALDPGLDGATTSSTRPGTRPIYSDPLEAASDEERHPCYVDDAFTDLDILAMVKAEAEAGGDFAGVEAIPPPPRPHSRSARCRGRWARARELWLAAERTRLVLNTQGASSAAPQLVPAMKHLLTAGQAFDNLHVPLRLRAQAVPRDGNANQQRLQLRILQRASQVVRARRVFRRTGDTAARVLRRAGPEHYTRPEGLPAPYVPFESCIVAEPGPEAKTADMRDILQGTVAEFLLDEAATMRPAAEADDILQAENPRYNRVLGKHEEYIKYLHRPEARVLWKLAPASEARAWCAIASVLKSSGVEQRKILMVVPFNTAGRPLSELIEGGYDYGMLAGAALNQVDIPSDLLCFATADQNNAFSHIRVPPWWHRYQCGPRVRARELPADWWAGKYRPDQWLRPQYLRLAMGHIYAVLLLSVINARIMQAVRASWKKFGELAFLNDAEV